jgi:hypothetical protein
LYLYSIKIQTDIDQNTVINLEKITFFFEIIFKEFFCSNGPDPARKETRPKSAQNKTGLLSTGLDSAQQHGLGWGSSPKQQ